MSAPTLPVVARVLRLAIAAAFLVALTGCGGGGDSTVATAEPVSRGGARARDDYGRPVAIAVPSPRKTIDAFTLARR